MFPSRARVGNIRLSHNSEKKKALHICRELLQHGCGLIPWPLVFKH